MNFEFWARLSPAHLLLLLTLAISQASRSEGSSIIYGSGENANLSLTYQRDQNWNIVAIPSTNNIGSPPTPYQAYVPRTVDGGWVYGGNSGTNGSQTGVNYGGNTNYWITPSPTTNSIVNPVSATYNWIAAQTFTITSAGNYDFKFYGAGDDEIRFFIDGDIDSTDPQKPVVIGGTQIGGVGSYGGVTQFTGTAYMTAGTHTAYMSLYNAGGATGALIGQSLFTAAVPEPSTVAMALGGLACGGFLMRRRRKRA